MLNLLKLPEELQEENGGILGAEICDGEVIEDKK